MQRQRDWSGVNGETPENDCGMRARFTGKLNLFRCFQCVRIIDWVKMLNLESPALLEFRGSKGRESPVEQREPVPNEAIFDVQSFILKQDTYWGRYINNLPGVSQLACVLVDFKKCERI